MSIRWAWAVLILAVTCGSRACADSEVKTLPIVTGNFSVSWIQHSPVGAFPDPNFNGEGVPPPENWAGHHKAGLNAYEDYVAWGAVEREPGKWDWSRQIEVANAQRAGGLEYDPYLWIHNPPMWMREGKLPANDADAPDHYTLLKCLEHGETTYTFSIWDPATVKWFERFYREMHRALGDKIGRTYVGMIGPYGEGNYPLPMFDWLNIGHCHEGYWCGDAYARRAFRQAMKNRYVTLAKLNGAWGTSFARWTDVDFPSEIRDGKILKAEERSDPKARRRWVDFIEWYHQSIIDFSVEVAKAALKHFPIEQLKMKPGGSAGGVNPIAWGTYCPGYARAVGRARVLPSHRQASTSTARQEPRPPSPIRLQPADCGGRPFGDRWYGTAYRFYGVPLTTEPAGGLSQRDFRRRLFMDACNGATEMFSYEWDKHKEDGLKWIHLYDGVPSITDVAVYCPTTWYRMNGDIWPAIRAADALRDITDFEVADELLIKDDYLRKTKTRVLIWLQGPVVERSVLEKIVRWVEEGGILVARAAHPPTDVEARDGLSLRLFPDADEPVTCLGQGLVIRFPYEGQEREVDFQKLVRSAVYHPERLGSAGSLPAEPRNASEPLALHAGALEVDGKSDGVWTAVFPNRLLLMNTGDKPVDVERPWNGRTVKIHLEAGELAEIK